jgi:hypothetical protein
MAVTTQSVDEITTFIVDTYEDTINKDNPGQPKRIWRNNNNKLYLVFRSIAAGFKLILDAVLSQKSRFDPLHCDNVDLYTTAKLVGTKVKEGTGSIVRITITNKDITESKIFEKGAYNYTSVSGMVFSFELADDYLFDPGEKKIVSAISIEKGSYRVENNTNIKLTRSDNAAIEKAFVFSCSDNLAQLGYADEDESAFRERILNDTNRQDHIKELELRIRNLPNIFECNLILNQGDQFVLYDGITLAPNELLITITGVPTNQIAELVARDVLYTTHQTDPDLVVYYDSEYYIGGRYPVYFRYHNTTDFSLSIEYQYNSGKLKSAQIEDAINSLLEPYTYMVTHVDMLSEEDVYKVLSNLNLPSVKVLDANVIDSAGNDVPYIRIPKTRLPHLTSIIFTAIDEGGAS